MQSKTLTLVVLVCVLGGCAQKDGADDPQTQWSPSLPDGSLDAGMPSGSEAGMDAGFGAAPDAGVAPAFDGGVVPGPDASSDASVSVGMDAAPAGDAAADAGGDAALLDAAMDAASEGGAEAGADSGGDAALVLPGTAVACPDAQLLNITSSLPACDLCANARCLPTSLVTSTNPESVDQLGACGDGDNKCVPDAYAITRGQVKLKNCTSLAGAEGRCMSVCIPLVAAQGDKLPRDNCADDERCAPCFDPTSGEETGACSLGCTEPPSGPPVTFEKCCSGAGSCVSRELAGAQADQLNPDSCTDKSGATLCAPDDIASDKPATCRSVNDSEGRCLSRCLTSVQEQESSLPQSTCASTHRCVPCYDPRAAQPTSTGACELNGDAPVEPPKTFTPCCSGDGLCVPTADVPEAQRANLTQLSCQTGQLCTPKAAVAEPDGGAFAGNATCQTDISGILGSLAGDGQAGICAPICFQPAAPDDQLLVGGQPLQGSCASSSQFCAPCVHPTEGTNLGVCPPTP
jgi:hypothetical protein